MEPVSTGRAATCGARCGARTQRRCSGMRAGARWRWMWHVACTSCMSTRCPLTPKQPQLAITWRGVSTRCLCCMWAPRWHRKDGGVAENYELWPCKQCPAVARPCLPWLPLCLAACHMLGTMFNSMVRPVRSAQHTHPNCCAPGTQIVHADIKSKNVLLSAGRQTAKIAVRCQPKRRPI